MYRRHYSADNCCITLYGKMDMADKLARRWDKDYLSKMPKTAARPRLTMQDEQPGAFVELPYYTDQPKPDEVQCALAWYTGAFADRERQLGVEILLGALLSTNSSPLKAALLAEQLGADIDIGFHHSTLQPTLELLLRGATVDSARKFAPAVRKSRGRAAKDRHSPRPAAGRFERGRVCLAGAPGQPAGRRAGRHQRRHRLAHTGDAALLLHTDKLFRRPAQQAGRGLVRHPAAGAVCPRPGAGAANPHRPQNRGSRRPARTDGKLVLEHPLTAADLGAGDAAPQGSAEQLAGATLLRHPSAGSLYLNFYYDLGTVTPEELQYLNLLTDVLDELDTPAHTAQQLNTLRSTWLGDSRAQLDLWTGRQEGAPCHAKLTLCLSLLERSLEKAVEIGGEWLYDTLLTSAAAEAAYARVVSQLKLRMEQLFIQQGNEFASTRARAHYYVEGAADEAYTGVSYYHFLCSLLEKADWAALGAKLDALRSRVLQNAALTVSLHGTEAALEKLRTLLPESRFAAARRTPAQPYTQPLTPPVNGALYH